MNPQKGATRGALTEKNNRKINSKAKTKELELGEVLIVEKKKKGKTNNLPLPRHLFTAQGHSPVPGDNDTSSQQGQSLGDAPRAALGTQHWGHSVPPPSEPHLPACPKDTCGRYPQVSNSLWSSPFWFWFFFLYFLCSTNWKCHREGNPTAAQRLTGITAQTAAW